MKRYIINQGNEDIALKINARGKKFQFNVETKVEQQKTYLCAQWLLNNQVEFEILSFIPGHWRISMGYTKQWSRVYYFSPQNQHAAKQVFAYIFNDSKRTKSCPNGQLFVQKI